MSARIPFGASLSAPARARNARPSCDATSPVSAGAHCAGERVVAGEEHGEHPAAQRLEADVGVDVAERQTPLRVENETELRRQTA